MSAKPCPTCNGEGLLDHPEDPSAEKWECHDCDGMGFQPSEKEGCARLMEEAEYEIFDVVNDGQPVVIELHPGHNGRSSYLFWRPLKDHNEAQLWEFVHDSPGAEIRNVSFIGEPANALRKFISANPA